jgi:hypothetical protein
MTAFEKRRARNDDFYGKKQNEWVTAEAYRGSSTGKTCYNLYLGVFPFITVAGSFVLQPPPGTGTSRRYIQFFGTSFNIDK